MWDLKLPMPLTGLAEDVRTGRLSGSPSRRTSGRPVSGAASPGTLCGAGEEGQEEGHGNSKKFPAPGDIGLIVRWLRGGLLPRRRGGERGLSPRGRREEEEGFPDRGGQRVQEGKDYSPGQLRQRQCWRRRVALKGQASGKIISIRIPE